MREYLLSKKDLLIRGAKIAVGCGAAILVCELLGVGYATSAGIITLLTVQNTKRATLELSAARVLSFVLTMALGFAVARLLGIHALGFGVFMLLMVEISYLLGWGDAVSTNAVFGTHLFMMEGQFSLSFVVNELALLVVGTGIAVLLNLVMPDKEKEIRARVAELERTMSELMQEMADSLRDRSALPAVVEDLEGTVRFLDEAVATASSFHDNALREHTAYYIKFFEMRRDQCITLLHICSTIRLLDPGYRVDGGLLEFLEYIAETFSFQNDAAVSLERLSALLEDERQRPLPDTHRDFEQQALLFHCTKELEEFFELKQRFLAGLGETERSLYLQLV